MPNRPVRDKWDYPRKMERHFPIKPRQPIGIGSCHFLSFPNSLIRAKNRFVKNGTANFDRNIPTEISGPPPEVIPNIPVGRNRNGPFHLNSDRNFRNLWHNGRHPLTSVGFEPTTFRILITVAPPTEIEGQNSSGSWVCDRSYFTALKQVINGYIINVGRVAVMLEWSK